MGCFSSKRSRKKAKPSLAPTPTPTIKAHSLLKLGLAFCQVHHPDPLLVPKYRTFLLFSSIDLRQITNMQRAIFFDLGRNPTPPVDIRENDSKKVISLCLEGAADLRENLHLALDMLDQKGSGDLLVVFEQNSLGKEDLFVGSNVQCFSEEFVKFCMVQREKLRVDIVTDHPDLPSVLRLEACRHSSAR